MTKEDWMRAAEAHRKAADTFLRIFEPDAALVEMTKALDAQEQVTRLISPAAQ